MTQKEYEEYYRNLYAPKNTKSSSSSGSSNKKNTGSGGSSGSSGSSSSSSSSSSDDNNNWYAELMETRGQLNNLITNTRSSKGSYDGDISTLKQAINTVDKSSPVVQNMLTYLTGLLGDQSYDNAYEDAISHVSRSMP